MVTASPLECFPSVWHRDRARGSTVPGLSQVTTVAPQGNVDFSRSTCLAMIVRLVATVQLGAQRAVRTGWEALSGLVLSGKDGTASSSRIATACSCMSCGWKVSQSPSCALSGGFLVGSVQFSPALPGPKAHAWATATHRTCKFALFSRWGLQWLASESPTEDTSGLPSLILVVPSKGH